MGNAPRTVANRDGLYFMLSGGCIKIGRTNDVNNRLRHMRTHCPGTVELLGWWPGMGWNERVWHYAFRWSHTNGEWHKDTPELRRAIEAAISGREWIAELGADWESELQAERGWPAMEGLFSSKSAYAVHLRRNAVADFEEDLACRLDENEDYATTPTASVEGI